MRIFTCTCANSLFFGNTRCLACGLEAGWCPQCRAITPWQASGDGSYVCASPGCGANLQKCHNYAAENVCNRGLLAGSGAAALCDCCDYNDTIPDLSVEGNRQKWARLEAAKRRLIYGLDLLGLPRPDLGDAAALPLRFDFKADVIPGNEFWRAMSERERVYTGHAEGKITINIREADPAEREKLRVDLEEAHRTLIGHFRHEIGHYYWDLLVRGRCEEGFVAVFGDHTDPDYGQALDRHYEQGPPADWRTRFVSAYASMHPWEDFAETFATYLEMVCVLDTAGNVALSQSPEVRTAALESMVEAYRRLGIAMNEMNRTMGLLDYVPEVFIPPVVAKMGFVHDLLRGAARAA